MIEIKKNLFYSKSTVSRVVANIPKKQPTPGRRRSRRIAIKNTDVEECNFNDKLIKKEDEKFSSHTNLLKTQDNNNNLQIKQEENFESISSLKKRKIGVNETTKKDKKFKRDEEKQETNLSDHDIKPPSEDESDNEEISEYEQKVKDNIAERRRILEGLGIFNDMNSLKELAPKKPEQMTVLKKEKLTKVDDRPKEIRRSKRLSYQPAIDYLKEVVIGKSFNEDEVDPIAAEGHLNSYYALDDEEKSSKFLKTLPEKCSYPDYNTVCRVWDGSDSQIKNQFKNLSVTGVSKVGSSRILSIEFHPSKEKKLAFVGAKWGDLGIWDIEEKCATDAIFRYKIHQAPINSMSFDVYDENQLYTTSYDGTFRSTDLTSLNSKQEYVCEESNQWITYHAQKDKNCFLVSRNKGFVDCFDLREEQSKVSRYILEEKKSIKVVRIHPIKKHVMATASSTGTIAIWDLRSMKNGKPLSYSKVGRTLSGLDYSPVTGNFLLSCCSDDKIRISTVENENIRHLTSIKHNNDTGRWLTTFRPKWLPGSEQHFTIGSMLFPRRIELFNRRGDLLHNFKDENLTTVNCVIAVHPYHKMLIGGNSSGKVYVLS